MTSPDAPAGAGPGHRWHRVRTQAKPHSTRALRWTMGVIVSAVITAVVTVVVTNYLTHEPNPAASSTASGSATGTPSGSATTSPPAGGQAVAPFTVAVHDRTSPCGPNWVVPDGNPAFPSADLDSDYQWLDWATTKGAVAGGSDKIEFAVQGSSEAQVVLLRMRVRVVTRAQPVKGTAYGLACGGDGVYRWITADLDTPLVKLSSDYRPTLDPGDVPEQRRGPVKFPYTVALNDSEVFDVYGDTKTCDCTWVIELDWTSRGETGTYLVDNKGKPFRTTGRAAVNRSCIKQVGQPIDPATDCATGPVA